MYQKVIITGNLGRSPELRYTQKGKAVASFPVAVNDRYKLGDGTEVNNTYWFKVTAWGKLAEVCNQYLEKGRTVLVEGELVADKDTGGPKVYQKRDGSHGASFEIKASTVKFLSGTDRKTTDRGGGYNVEDEDPPF